MLFDGGLDRFGVDDFVPDGETPESATDASSASIAATGAATEAVCGGCGALAFPPPPPTVSFRRSLGDFESEAGLLDPDPDLDLDLDLDFDLDLLLLLLLPLLLLPGSATGGSGAATETGGCAVSSGFLTFGSRRTSFSLSGASRFARHKKGGQPHGGQKDDNTRETTSTPNRSLGQFFFFFFFFFFFCVAAVAVGGARGRGGRDAGVLPRRGDGGEEREGERKGLFLLSLTIFHPRARKEEKKRKET